MTIGKELIEKCLAYLRQLFELVQFYNRCNTSAREIVICFEYFTKVQEFFSPLLISRFLKTQLSRCCGLNYKIILPLVVPFEENVPQFQIVHALQFKKGSVAGISQGVNHFCLSTTPFTFCQ